MKICSIDASDEARVVAARRMLGEAMVLMVDANGNYTPDLALRSMERIAPYGIHWYEEPLALRDGAIAVSDQPGLGITLNEDALKRYTAA